MRHDQRARAAPDHRARRIDRYDPTEIEPRWQQRWDELGLHHTDLHDDIAARATTC